ncbi:MAG: hypothetical protein BAJATHORv1_10035 [Candidatus Thorarchaeota archaeon]|nr:MAG: hypothetical protein BAJATHORv1_10035 [Candidatus Thorarchaeota archaeon]
MVKTVTSLDDNVILLSIHDISPMYEDEIISLYDRLSEIGIKGYTLLIPPFYQLKGSNVFKEGDIFVGYLRSLGLEISLHGYSHTTKSGGMDEFKKLSSERSASRLKSGIAMIRRAFRIRPYGFVPPAWQATQKVLTQVRDVGLKYCVLGNYIHSFERDEIFVTADHIISQGDGKASFSDSMLELELGGPLQISIHPRDYESDYVFSIMEDIVDRLGYKILGYRDYLQKA